MATDKRAKPAGIDAVPAHTGDASGHSDGVAETGGDDLDALSKELVGFGHGEPVGEAEDDLDLGALAAVAGRGSEVVVAPAADAQARVDKQAVTAGASSAATLSAPPPRSPSAPPNVPAPLPASAARSPWLMPMLAGLGLGVGLTGLFFGLSAHRSDAPPAAVVAAPLDQGRAQASASPPPPPPPPLSGPAAAPSVPSAAPPSAAPTPAPSSRSPQALAPRNEPDPLARKSAGSSHRVASEPQAPIVAQRSTPEPTVRPTPGSTPATKPTAAQPTVEPDHQASAKAAPAAANVDALLDEALSAPAQRSQLQARRESALAQESIPIAPSREDVNKAVSVLVPAIHGCAMGQKGLATANIAVRGDGHVASVEVTGPPFSGTASGRCMEGVLRRAQLPRFKTPLFRVKFPLAIQ